MKYTHDCIFCQFLGTFEDHDLYFCDCGGFPTVLARFGNRGANTISGLQVADKNPILGEARTRAIQQGYLHPDFIPSPPVRLRHMIPDTIIAITILGLISWSISLLVRWVW